MDENIEEIKKRLDVIESKLDYIIEHLESSDFSTVFSRKLPVERSTQKKHTPYEMYQIKKRWIKDSFLKPVKKMGVIP